MRVIYSHLDRSDARQGRNMLLYQKWTPREPPPRVCCRRASSSVAHDNAPSKLRRTCRMPAVLDQGHDFVLALRECVLLPRPKMPDLFRLEIAGPHSEPARHYPKATSRPFR